MITFEPNDGPTLLRLPAVASKAAALDAAKLVPVPSRPRSFPRVGVGGAGQPTTSGTDRDTRGTQTTREAAHAPHLSPTPRGLYQPAAANREKLRRGRSPPARHTADPALARQGSSRLGTLIRSSLDPI